MTKPALYAPALAGARIPMPDRGGRLMPATGVTVDLTMPYYRRMIADGDIAPVKPVAAKGKAGGKKEV